MNIDNAIKLVYARKYPGEVAHLLEKSPPQVSAVEGLPAGTMAVLLDHVDPSCLRSVFLQLPDDSQVRILESASVRLALLVLRSLEAGEQSPVLEKLNLVAREELAKLLEFPEGTAGYYMDKPSAQFQVNDTVSEALTKLQAAFQQRARSIYVVDEANVLQGRVDMQDMALTDNATFRRRQVHFIIPGRRG